MSFAPFGNDDANTLRAVEGPPLNAAESFVPSLPAEHPDADTEAWHLRRALASQPVIEQAKGMLMLRFGMSADSAFQFLRRLSQAHNVKLRDIAAVVVALGLEGHLPCPPSC